MSKWWSHELNIEKSRRETGLEDCQDTAQSSGRDKIK